MAEGADKVMQNVGFQQQTLDKAKEQAVVHKGMPREGEGRMARLIEEVVHTERPHAAGHCILELQGEAHKARRSEGLGRLAARTERPDEVRPAVLDTARQDAEQRGPGKARLDVDHNHRQYIPGQQEDRLDP